MARMPLQKGSQTLDPDILTFCLGHPAFPRRIACAIQEAEKRDRELGCDSGYGGVWDRKEAIEILKREGILTPGDVYISQFYGTDSLDQAVELVNEWIAEATQELKEKL